VQQSQIYNCFWLDLLPHKLNSLALDSIFFKIKILFYSH
jgi:hypothetical protein